MSETDLSCYFIRPASPHRKGIFALCKSSNTTLDSFFEVGVTTPNIVAFFGDMEGIRTASMEQLEKFSEKFPLYGTLIMFEADPKNLTYKLIENLKIWGEIGDDFHNKMCDDLTSLVQATVDKFLESSKLGVDNSTPV